MLSMGFCGSFTTFSTYSLDLITLVMKKQYKETAILFFLTNILSILGAYCGYLAAKN